MSPETPSLSLVIVSEDWFALSLFKSAAEETGQFGRITAADDGYTALAEIWQAVEDGAVADMVLIDQNACDQSAGRLVAELRADSSTQHIFIAAFCSEPQGSELEVDMVAEGDALQPHLPDIILAFVARRALARALKNEAAA